jgi:hypothetical protein
LLWALEAVNAKKMQIEAKIAKEEEKRLEAERLRAEQAGKSTWQRIVE